MPDILFNAFSFLQKQLKEKNIPFSNHRLSVSEGVTVTGLLTVVGLVPEDVEGVFINGTIKPLETVLKDGDRVALFPPGTPGPYRLLLGIKERH